MNRPATMRQQYRMAAVIKMPVTAGTKVSLRGPCVCLVVDRMSTEAEDNV